MEKEINPYGEVVPTNRRNQMKKTLILLNLLLLLLPQYTFAECQTITEGTYFNISATSSGSTCYKYYVHQNNMPVFTLKHKTGQADFDLAVYSDSSLSNQISSSTSSGTATEMLTLSIDNYGRYLYAKVTNYSNSSATYALYTKQVDFASKLGEVMAETAAVALIGWAIKGILGIEDNSSETTQNNVGRASTTIMSMLQGKRLAGTSRDLLINEVKRELVGDGIISDFTVNYAVSIIDEIYEHY